MYGLLVLFHVLAATIWLGGHIVLAVVILPKALARKSPKFLLDFESSYEKIGMPALIVLVLTGLALVYRMLPDIGLWLTISNPVVKLLLTKVTLLTLVVCFAISARFRVIPKLSSKNIHVMAWHIISVTILSVVFAIVGVSFRAGWFY